MHNNSKKLVILGLVSILLIAGLHPVFSDTNQPEITKMDRKIQTVKAVAGGGLIVTVSPTEVFELKTFTVHVQVQVDGNVYVDVKGAVVTCYGAFPKTGYTSSNGKVGFIADLVPQDSVSYDVSAKYTDTNGNTLYGYGGKIKIKNRYLVLSVSDTPIPEGLDIAVVVKDQSKIPVSGATVNFNGGEYQTNILGVAVITAPNLLKSDPLYKRYDLSATKDGYQNSDTKTINVSNINCQPDTPSWLDAPVYIDAPSDGSGTGYFTVKTTDKDGDQVKYSFGWGDNNDIEWPQLFPSGEPQTIPLSFLAGKIYNVKVQAWDECGAKSDWSGSKTIVVGNLPPNKPSKPSISGTLKKNVDISFKTYATDPNNKESSTDEPGGNGDTLRYMFYWGDNTYSEWSGGSYLQGETAELRHSYSASGTFSVKVKAKDNHGSESDWSDPATVRIAKSTDSSSSIIITPSAPAGSSSTSPSSSISSSPSISSSLSSSSSQPSTTQQSAPATTTPASTPTATTTTTATSTAPTSKSSLLASR